MLVCLLWSAPGYFGLLTTCISSCTCISPRQGGLGIWSCSTHPTGEVGLSWTNLGRFLAALLRPSPGPWTCSALTSSPQPASQLSSLQMPGLHRTCSPGRYELRRKVKSCRCAGGEGEVWAGLEIPFMQNLQLLCISMDDLLSSQTRGFQHLGHSLICTRDNATRVNHAFPASRI